MAWNPTKPEEDGDLLSADIRANWEALSPIVSGIGVSGAILGYVNLGSPPMHISGGGTVFTLTTSAGKQCNINIWGGMTVTGPPDSHFYLQVTPGREWLITVGEGHWIPNSYNLQDLGSSGNRLRDIWMGEVIHMHRPTPSGHYMQIIARSDGYFGIFDASLGVWCFYFDPGGGGTYLRVAGGNARLLWTGGPDSAAPGYRTLMISNF